MALSLVPNVGETGEGKGIVQRATVAPHILSNGRGWVDVKASGSGELSAQSFYIIPEVVFVHLVIDQAAVSEPIGLYLGRAWQVNVNDLTVAIDIKMLVDVQ